MAKVLVLGAGGNFGSNAARAFAAAGWEVARYSRGTDMTVAAQGASVIVNALNPPIYHDWARLIPQITGSAIAAAKSSGARLVLPGNVYVYGNQTGPWGPDTPQIPCARKGAIRVASEQQYKDSGLPVLILRGGDFIDETSDSTMLNMFVLKGIAKGKMTLPGTPGVRRAYAYLPDMARAAVDLVALGQDLPHFADIPFAGLTFSVSDLRAEVERQMGQTVKTGNFPWWAMRLASPVWELARELTEMRYLFETPHSLDGAPLARLLPDFNGVDLAQVVRVHLARHGVGAVGASRQAAILTGQN